MVMLTKESIEQLNIEIREIGKSGEKLGLILTEEEKEILRLRETRARSLSERIVEKLGIQQRYADPSLGDAECAKQGLWMARRCRNPEIFREFVSDMVASAKSPGEFLTLMGDDVAAKSAQFAALWAKSGLPSVSIPDQEFVASLATTGMNKEFSDMLRAPWRAFRIAIPGGLLSISTDEGDEPVRRIAVMSTTDDGWTIACEGPSRIIHITGESTDGLCEDIDVRELNVCNDPGIGINDHDGRCLRMAARIVLAACVSMDSRYGNGPCREAPKKGRKRIVAGGSPIVRYVITRPVVLKSDMREAVREYISNGGKSPTVRVPVRGHWKMQPCGPGGAERKFIHIEPYWRGPEDAPIAVRPHILRQ